MRTELQVLIHLCIFLPLLIFGILYQLTTSAHEPMPGDAPAKAAA